MKKNSPDFDYIMGVEVSSLDEIPAGMVSLTIPASEYAAMPFVKLGNADGMAAANYIMKERLPTSGYAQKTTPGFIYYDERFFPIDRKQGYAGNPVVEFYAPVIPK